MDHTVYVQITPCLPFLRKRSPDGVHQPTTLLSPTQEASVAGSGSIFWASEVNGKKTGDWFRWLTFP